ncbi:MAG: hypothetical protein V3571_10615 [Pseudodesulfovibrio sp.]
MNDKDTTQRDWTHDYFFARLGQLTFNSVDKDLLLVPEPYQISPATPGATAVARRRPHFLITQGYYDLYFLLF